MKTPHQRKRAGHKFPIYIFNISIQKNFTVPFVDSVVLVNNLQFCSCEFSASVPFLLSKERIKSKVGNFCWIFSTVSAADNPQEAPDVLLNAIHPFYRFVGKDMMEDLKYPLKSNTVPIWAVPVYAVLLPMVVFLLLYFRRKDVYDLHHAILGLLFSVLVTAVITDAIKDAVGRPRPDFFWRCFPDGKDVYDQWGDVVCHGDKNVVKEGHKSFPSGHTSLSFAGLGFLSLYLSGKIQVFDCRGHVAKLCLVLLPLLLASLVAISRVDDYWHHWQDVVAGGLIGLVVAALCYLQFFPPPYHDQGWATYAYFRALEESQGTANGENANANNTRSAEVQIACRQNERSNNSRTGISLSGDSGPNVEDLESGRR